MSDIPARSQSATGFRIPWVRLAPWLYTLALFAIWELAVALTGISHTILPAPSRVLAAIIQYWGPIQRNSIQTLFTTLAGFGIAVVAGLAIGLFIGWSSMPGSIR